MPVNYTWQVGMQDLVGGVYEADARKMVDAGVKWLDAHPTATIEFSSDGVGCGYLSETIYPDLKTMADSLKALNKITYDTDSLNRALWAILWIRRYGWASFVAIMS
jgi:hypothetical protein